MTDLPNGWVESTIGQVADFVRGVTYKKPQQTAEPGPGRVALLRATNITATLHLDQDLVFVPADVVKETQYLRSGDVVIATSSGSLSVVGKSARLRKDWPGTFGAFCGVLRARPEIDPGYLAAFVQSQRVRREWSSQAKGTNINNLKPRDIGATSVPLPPLDEQHRIVAAIEEQFSRLDGAEGSVRRSIANLGVLRRALLHHLFLGDWPMKPLAEVTDPGRLVQYGILMPKDDVAGGVPYVRVKDFPKDRIIVGSLRRTAPEIAQKYLRSTLKPKDVLLSIRGTYGRVAIVPEELDGANITQDTARIAPLPELRPDFLATYLRSGDAQLYFKRVARGVAVKGVNIGDLRAMPIPVPTLPEQERIVGAAEEQLSIIDSMHASADLVLRRGDSLRKSILIRAFRGELVSQDPADAPADEGLGSLEASPTASESRARTRLRIARTGAT